VGRPPFGFIFVVAENPDAPGEQLIEIDDDG
jgi:hypothetical protein